MSTPKIQKLDEVVINRIAAGEVIQRPANAIKEMIENCLDAKSKSIQVVVKDGGLKLLQIQDDGCGIRKEDLDIVCERFTTSKLSSFDDLKSISTYGFRGEALASISHVAHLTITTKTSDSPCAYKAKYEDGKMIPLQHGGKVEPKPCAGNKGTQITVEDLFYNVAVRRKALRNPNEEHSKIVDVISKYAIHNPTVGFSLKKSGQNLADVRTQSKSTTIDNIKTIYGPTLSKELLEVTHEDSQYGFKLHGFASNANYSIKKTIILLFINHRLVESTALRKAIEAVYVNYLPKDKHPFMYISLELNPLNIDVNVHPTKHEVKFLHEEAIIESIQKCLEAKLLGANESRQYYTQSLIPKMLSAGVDCPVSDVVGAGGKSDDDNTTKKLYAHQLVRTDAKERKMEAFFPYAASKTDELAPKDKTNIVADDLRQDTVDNTINTSPIDELITPPACSNELKSKKDCSSESVKENVMDVDDHTVNHNSSIKHAMNNQKASGNCKEDGTKKETIKNPPTERIVKLSSIRNLRRAIDADEHLGLKSLLQEHKFVGCVNQSLALIQHLTQLYLINVEKLSQHLFYQIIMFRFGNMGYLELSEPAPIRELVRLVLDTPDSGWEPEDGDKDDLARFSSELLTSKADMLLDYFSVEINEKGEITAMPSLLDNYIPNWNKLPILLLRLASEVDWDNEERCFRDFAEELSHFYSCGGDPFIGENEAEESEKEYNHTIEHAIFPALRTDFIPSKSLSTDGTFLEVANLPDLYKVFERC